MTESWLSDVISSGRPARGVAGVGAEVTDNAVDHRVLLERDAPDLHAYWFLRVDLRGRLDAIGLAQSERKIIIDHDRRVV